MYDENKNAIKKLSPEGLRKFNHSSGVTEDEIYFFRKPVNPPKVGFIVENFWELLKPVLIQSICGSKNDNNFF